MARITARRRVTRIDLDTGVHRAEDVLAAEEPLEIRVGGRSLAVTMRTPGHDVELAAGFLVSEGVVTAADHVVAARYCAGATDEGLNTYNVLDVTLARDVPAPDPSLERSFYTTSSCGLCGKASIDAVRTHSHWTVDDDELVLPADLLATFPDRLREHQDVFDRTGGLHAAALFDGATGELLVLREDVGRHNAVDKVVGWALTGGPAAAARHGAHGVGARVVRAHPEGAHGGHPRPRGRVGAVVARRRPRARVRDHARRLPAGVVDGRVLAAGARAACRVHA